MVNCKDVQDHLLEQSKMNSIEMAGSKWVSLSQKEHMTLVEIHEMVDNLYNGTNR